jgi:hypothetical protein
MATATPITNDLIGRPSAVPVMRTGAMGRIRSVYIRHPDGNLIEISELIDD